jgi:hypothetical protein
MFLSIILIYIYKLKPRINFFWIYYLALKLYKA